MKRPIAALAIATLSIALQGCKTGYSRATTSDTTDQKPPKCATAAVNASLISDGVKVFNLIAGLTCASKDYTDGFITGQSLGYGNDLDNPGNLGNNEPENHSYERLIDDVDVLTLHTPAIVEVDYEFKQLYTADELKTVNNTLEQHWKEKGLVAITWKPLSPFKNSADNIEGNRGTSDDVLFPPGGSLDLRELLETDKTAYTVWQRKLQAMTVALKDLQTRGVVVLWRPLPEMNSPTYWWGTQASDLANNNSGAKLYTDIWKNMYDYFKTQGVNNLLWVYSPSESTTEYKIDWAYPGNDYVDIVAGNVSNDQLSIKDYTAMVNIGKPVGMAEYGPSPTGPFATSGLGTERGNFDNTTFADRLRGSYPAVAFWINKTSKKINDTTRSNLALIDNLKTKELMDRSYIYSAEKIAEKKMRE
jgi:mannan endo-1,4-beta-mannosidase